MKKIIVFIILFVSVKSFAQVEAMQDITAQRAITAAGKPNGAKTEMKIGKEGGSLRSSDGKLQLVIPRGAIAKKTGFSILPITNMAPNGNGKAYRLEPSGIKFEEPVQLIFHYSDEELADSTQLLLGIAMQDNSGQWYGLRKFVADTFAKTISGNISHFSDWSTFESIKLYPSYKRLKVKKTLDLTIDLVSGEEEELSMLNSDELSPLTKMKIPWTVTFKANEIINGNAAVGRIAVHSKVFTTYKAPDLVPAKNPVAVTAELKGISYKYRGTVFRDLTLVSNILVYDNAYEVTMVSSISSTAGSVLGMVTYKDTGSFVVSVNGKEVKLIEKVNKNASDEFSYKGNCDIKLLNPGSNHGLIHITGVNQIGFLPGSATHSDLPTIGITFKQMPVRLSSLLITCPETRPYTSSDNGMMSMIPALPGVIFFKIQEGEHIIHQVGKEGDELYQKFTVKQIKED
jgi:hypothetical protein